MCRDEWGSKCVDGWGIMVCVCVCVCREGHESGWVKKDGCWETDHVFNI